MSGDNLAGASEVPGSFASVEPESRVCADCGFTVEPADADAHDRECNRPRWLADRMERVGCSEIGCLFDANEYETREYLIGRKVGIYREQDLGDAGAFAAAAEPWVIDCARAKFRWRIQRAPQRQIVDLVCPRLGATPDAYVQTPYGIAVAQIKVVSCKEYEIVKKYGGRPPLSYQLQVMGEMAVTGAKLGCLLVMHTMGGLNLRAYGIPRNEQAIERIRFEVDRVWAEIETQRQERGYYSGR